MMCTQNLTQKLRVGYKCIEKGGEGLSVVVDLYRNEWAKAVERTIVPQNG